MKLFAKKEVRTRLDDEIDKLHDKLQFRLEPKEYTAMSEHLLRLYEAKSKENSRSISPDTIAMIAGNLLGIGLIINYEKAGIITSKALGFIIKGRI